jgi:hypothetical protein
MLEGERAVHASDVLASRFVFKFASGSTPYLRAVLDRSTLGD